MTRRMLVLVGFVCLVLAGFVVWGVRAVDAGRLLQEREFDGRQAWVAAHRASRSSSGYRVNWKRRYHREHRHVQKLLHQRRTIRTAQTHNATVAEALNLAAAVYGNAPTLWRRARCETGGTFDPRAYNPSSGASGLFQFLPSTWASTPFAGFSVWSPYASALAAGWMIVNGRGGEWECR